MTSIVLVSGTFIRASSKNKKRLWPASLSKLPAQQLKIQLVQ
jgi:hypothetical protein